MFVNEVYGNRGKAIKNILAKNRQDEAAVKELIGKSLPAYRMAYSDRTAWLMACMSEPAYVRFNPVFSDRQKQQIAGLVADTVKKSDKTSLLALMDKFSYDHASERQHLEGELALLDYKLVKTFDNEGTQAILATNKQNVVLAFGGTEATSIKDINADAKAVQRNCETGGRIHCGFSNAYEQVARDIEIALNDEALASKPLFITGQSLGGAPATIAAKKLVHTGGNANCYTYGVPKVGDENWVSDIKTPIYRIVNAADCVTMLTPSDELLRLIAWLIGLIPHVGRYCRKLMFTKLGGYMHGGNICAI